VLTIPNSSRKRRPAGQTGTPTLDMRHCRDNPLDALLRRLAERSPAERVRSWAAGLLVRGEVATSGAGTAVNPQREVRRNG
jgi:hypothetical protein